MSSAAITLQCPACGGVFLTLQQGTGGAEICPHCSMSAPRTRYRAAEAQSGPVARTVLPPRKAQTASQPIPLAPTAYQGAATLEAPPSSLLPARPPQGTPFNAVFPYRPSQASGPVPLPSFAPALPPAPVSGPIPIPMDTTPPAPVMSERVPLPPLSPGELPLPSRVLHTFEPGMHASYVAAHPEIQSGPVALPPSEPAPALVSDFSPPPTSTPWEAMPSTAVESPPFTAAVASPLSKATPVSVPLPEPVIPPYYMASPEPAASPYFAASPEPLASPYFVPPPESVAPTSATAEAAPELGPESELKPEPAPVASPFSKATTLPPLPEPPPYVPTVMAAPVIPPLEVPTPSAPAYEYQYPHAVETPPPAPQPMSQEQASFSAALPSDYYAAAPAPSPIYSPAPLPVPEPQAAAPAPVYVPVPAPAPASSPASTPVYAPTPLADPALAAKASPAQLWEAAILQHSQSQEPGSALTGRELFPAGVVPAFQAASSPFTQVIPTPGAASPVAVPILPQPAAMNEGPPPMASTPAERPLVTGTVLPSARSMPPATLPAGFGSLPAVDAAAEPLPPPQIGFGQGTGAALPISSPATTSLPPASSASPFSMAAASSPLATPPLPPPPGLSVQSAPVVPHAVQLRDAGAVVNLGPAPEGSPHHAATQNLTLVAAKVVRQSGPPPAARTSGKKLPWIAGLLLGSLALAGGLHFLKDKWGSTTTPALASNTKPTTPSSAPAKAAVASTDVTTPQVASATSGASPEITVKSAEVIAKPTALTPTTTTTPTTPPAAASGPAQEEVRRAMPSNADTLSITQEDPLPAVATKLMFGLDAATSPEERARWIANPDKYAASMERLFRMRGGRLNTREVSALPTPVYALPTGEEIPLFRVSSPASRGGAILRLHPQNGAYVIDWPLFAQSYDNAFDRFVATNRALPGKAEWYTVLCSLVGDPASKEVQRGTHLRLQVQGSLAETGSTEAWVDKTSPAGRYLLKQMAPRRMYLVDMQFGASETGSRRLMVLDCDATRGESAQANANK